MQVLRPTVAAVAALAVCSCVTMPASVQTPAPGVSAPAGDLSDAEPVRPPSEPLLTTRAPASIPLVQLPPPKDLYSLESLPDYNLSCDEFFGLLKSAQPSSVEEALQAVQRTRPKFLSRVLFAYETKMAFDGASLLYPRMVVYGGDAKTVLNFAGHPKQRFFDRVETMCFDDKEAEFKFFDLAFPKEEASYEPTSPEASAALTAEERLSKYVIVEGGRGVRTCKNCHQSPSRPNADTFALWPGFYGAADDTLKDRERPDNRNIYNSFESSMWARFQSIPSKNGRYKYVNQELMRPNSDFTLKISYLNGQRIVGDLRRLGAAFEPHKYEFAKALLCAPRAERRFFRQLTGDTSEGATFGVLPTNADAATKEIFLSAYYDEMQKERRLGAVLSEFSIPNPLPKERFEEMRKYYRSLLDPGNELNLDMRLSTVDVDEVLLVRELKKVTDKFDIDIENWSMVRDGGFVHENGMGGDGKVALRLILERPFTEVFLKDDTELTAAIGAREAKEQLFYTQKINADAAQLSQELEQENVKICGLIDRRLKPQTASASARTQ